MKCTLMKKKIIKKIKKNLKNIQICLHIYQLYLYLEILNEVCVRIFEHKNIKTQTNKVEKKKKKTRNKNNTLYHIYYRED